MPRARLDGDRVGRLGIAVGMLYGHVVCGLTRLGESDPSTRPAFDLPLRRHRPRGYKRAAALRNPERASRLAAPSGAWGASRNRAGDRRGSGRGACLPASRPRAHRSASATDRSRRRNQTNHTNTWRYRWGASRSSSAGRGASWLENGKDMPDARERDARVRHPRGPVEGKYTVSDRGRRRPRLGDTQA